MSIYEFNCYDEIAKVNIEYSQYIENNNIAIILRDAYDKSVWARLSVNIKSLPEGQFAVDVNNCPTAEEFLIKYGIAIPTGKDVISGYCVYPIYELTKPEYNKYLKIKAKLYTEGVH